LRVHVEAVRPSFILPKVNTSSIRQSISYAKVKGEAEPVPIYRRDSLSIEEQLAGPVLITEDHTTVFLKSGWIACQDEMGSLNLTRLA